MSFGEVLSRMGGRRKTLDESLSHQEVVALIRDLSPEIGINVQHSGKGFHELYESKHPDEVATFLQREFASNEFLYLDVKHQVFAFKGDSNQAHFIDVAEGPIKSRIGSEEKRGRPRSKARITYDTNVTAYRL